jgi:hypothetical protein
MILSRLRHGLFVAALMLAAGCPQSDPMTESTAPGRTRWTFTLGHQGEGIITFQANSRTNGQQSGECRDAVCRTTVDNDATLVLTPVPAAGFRYKSWSGDPTANLPCPGMPDANGTLSVHIVRNGACYVLFESSAAPTTPTTPGVR